MRFLSLLLLAALLPLRSNAEISVDECIQILEQKNPSEAIREVVFEERRHFPFRNKPAVVDGVARTHPELGVSIEYPKKRAALIVDDEGVLLRRYRSDQSFRDRSVNREGDATSDLIAATLTLDLETLKERFSLSAEGEGSDFVLRMVPEAKLGGSVQAVSMYVVAEEVERIEITMTEERSIEIVVLEETLLEELSEADRNMYFRSKENS